MKITKYGHACLFLQKNDQTIVLDPGCFTTLPGTLPTDVTGIIITEEHVDHYDLENIKRIRATNPEAVIYTTEAVNAQLEAAGIESTAITGDREVQIGDFTINLHETPHAPVHLKSPCMSLATRIDDALYYPSDTYRPNEVPVDILAIPTSGPWYKITEAIDLANSSKSQELFATHNALNSESGEMVAKKYLTDNLTDTARTWVDVEVGQSIEV